MRVVVVAPTCIGDAMCADAVRATVRLLGRLHVVLVADGAVS